MEKIKRSIIILELLIIAVISTFSYAEEGNNTITNSLEKNFIENQNNIINENNENLNNEILSNKSNVTKANILTNDIVEDYSNTIKDESSLESEEIKSEEESSLAKKTIDEGIYEIHSSLDDTKLLDVEGQSFNSGANIYIYQRSNVPNQKFKFIFNKEDGTYTILSVNSGKAMDVQNGGTSNETNVWQYEQNGSDAQKWYIIKNNDSSYSFISKLKEDLFLDISNANTNNCTNVQVYEGNGSNAQKFKILNKKITIVLNPGHGGNETGCANNWKGLVEKNVTLQIARYIRDYLSGIPDVTVILTRDGDYQMDLDDRAMIARNNNADLYVSLHINDESSHSASGSQMYVPFYEGQRHYNSEMTYLANLIQEELSYVGIGRNISGGIIKRNVDQIPRYQYLLNGQVVQADYYADIRHAMKGDTLDYGPDLNTETGVPAILVEHCFMNSSDSNFLDSDADLRMVAQADANAIKRYFGL